MLIQMTDALGSEVSPDVLHLRVDDLAVVAGGVQHEPVAAVQPYVRYGASPASLLEEDQITKLEVGLGYPLTVLLPVLFGRMIREPLAKVPEDELCKAGAVFFRVSYAGSGRRETVGSADVLPAEPYHVKALAHRARGAVDVLAGARAACGRRGGGAPDERYSIGDDLARAALGKDAHGVSVAGVHLVGADLDPVSPVSGLVDLCPPGAPCGLQAEAGGLGVALPGRPPSVEGIVALRGNLELEARVPRGVGSSRYEATPVGQTVCSVPLPSLRVKAPGIRVVHHLRIVGELLLLGYVLMNCAELGPGCPGDSTLREGRSRSLRLGTTVRCVGLRPSREGCN